MDDSIFNNAWVFLYPNRRYWFEQVSQVSDVAHGPLVERYFLSGLRYGLIVFLAPGVRQPGYPRATYTAPQSSHPNANLDLVVNFGPENTTGQTQYQPPSYSTLYQTPPQHYPTPSEVPEKQPSAPPPPNYDEVKQYFGHLGLWSRETLNFPSFKSHVVSWFLFL